MFDMSNDKIAEALATFGGNAAAIESLKEAVKEGKTIVIVGEQHVNKTRLLKVLMGAVPKEKKVAVLSSENGVISEDICNLLGKVDKEKVLRVAEQEFDSEERDTILVWDEVTGAEAQYNVDAWAVGVQGLVTVTSFNAVSAVELIADYYTGGSEETTSLVHRDAVKQICKDVDLFVVLDDDMLISEISEFNLEGNGFIKRTLLEAQPKLTEDDKAFKIIENAAKKGETILFVGHESKESLELFKEIACIVTENKETYWYTSSDEEAMQSYVREVSNGSRKPYTSGTAVAVENLSDVGTLFAMNTWGDGVQGLGVFRSPDGSFGADALRTLAIRYAKLKGLDIDEDYDEVRKELCNAVDLIVTMYNKDTVELISRPLGGTEGVGILRDVIYYHPTSEYAEQVNWEANKEKPEPIGNCNLDKGKVMEHLEMEFNALNAKTEASKLEGRPQLAVITEALANEYKRLMELLDGDQFKEK